MKKICVIMALLLAGAFFFIPSPASATERWFWLELNKEFDAGGYGPYERTGYNIGCVKVGPSDNLTFNVTKMSDEMHVNICMYTSTPALEWSDNLTERLYEPNGYARGYVWSYISKDIHAPKNMWVHPSSYDVVEILYNFSSTASNQYWGYKATLSSPPTEIDKLQRDLNNLNASVKSDMAKFDSSFRDNLTKYDASLRNTLAALQLELNALNSSKKLDVSKLQAHLEALNNSLTEMEAYLGDLGGKMGTNDTALQEAIEANSTLLKNITERLENNDTALQGEIARLNATPPATYMQFNNTTVVNTTEVSPTTFVNKTLLQETNGAPAGIAAGVVTGAAVGGVGVAVINRRLKKGSGG